MATKSKTPKSTAPTVAAPTVAVANPFAQLITAPTAPTVPAPKVHSINLNGNVVKAANHVATFKGTRAVVAGGVTYSLTGIAYTPAQGHVNATQWQAVQLAITENGGNPVTVAQVAAQFTALGLSAGLAQGFMAYRAKGAKPNLQAA